MSYPRKRRERTEREQKPHILSEAVLLARGDEYDFFVSLLFIRKRTSLFRRASHEHNSCVLGTNRQNSAFSAPDHSNRYTSTEALTADRLLDRDTLQGIDNVGRAFPIGCRCVENSSASEGGLDPRL